MSFYLIRFCRLSTDSAMLKFRQSVGFYTVFRVAVFVVVASASFF